MEQILFYELPRYLSLRDRNSLCLLNKEFYRKLHPCTPSWKEVEQKRKVNESLLQITQLILKSLNSTFPLYKQYPLKLRSMKEIKRISLDHEYDEVDYDCGRDYCLHCKVLKEFQYKLIWVGIYE